MKTFLAFLLCTLPAYAQYAHTSNPGTPGATGPAITSAGSGNCPGTGCVLVNTEGRPAYVAKIAGTYVGTLAFECTNDNGANLMPVYGYPLIGGQIGQATLNAGANATGSWWVPTLGYRQCGLYASAFTSNASMALNLDADPATIDAALFQNAPKVNCILTTSGTTSTVTSCAAPGANLRYYVTNASVYGGVATGATAAATIQSGTGGSCGSNTLILYYCQHAATAGCEGAFVTPKAAVVNGELCLLDATVGTKFVTVGAYVAP